MSFNDSNKQSNKVFLDFSPKKISYQQGYLGIEPSRVSGVLKINYPSTKPLIAKAIEIIFSGKEEIIWTEYQPNARGYTTSVVHSEQDEFAREEKLIWRAEKNLKDFSEKDPYEKLNQLDLPFSFKLENNLPSSNLIEYDDGLGRIYYRIVVIIYRKSNILKLQGKKKVIKFTIPITRYAKIPYKPEAIEWNAFRKDSVSYDVKIGCTIFDKGETIIFPIKLILHNPNVKIKKVGAGIKQYTRLWNGGSPVKSEKKYLASKEVEGDKINMVVDSGNEYYVEMEVTIPNNDSTKYSTSRSLITICHQIKVKIRLVAEEDILLERK
ncbi:717_t:CDS:1, partial [Funneliformis mosseae]